MTKLIVPTQKELTEYFLSEGLVSKKDIAEATKAAEAAFRTKFDPDEHPVCAVLGEETFNEVCNANFELIKKGVPMEERLDTVSELLDEKIREKAPLGSRQAAILDRDLLRAERDGALALESEEKVSNFLVKKMPWFNIFRRWFSIERNDYSSIRAGTSSGRIGRGWRRKWRKLRVVATTHGSNFTLKLFWFPVFSRSVVSTYVISTHYRGIFGIIPDAASPLRAGAIRNGVVKQNSGNSWIKSKAAVFIDSDPDLRNLTYFGNSSDAGISLSVSGTP